MAEQIQYVTLGVAEEIFAAPVATVQEILDMLPIARLPRAPENLLGMIDVRGKGVPVVMEKFESPVCWYALVADPDGNAVGIHQRKDGTCC